MAERQKEWPYRPMHITNDGPEIAQKVPNRKDLAKLTGLGIISNDHLRGIETDIWTNVECPTTIIEFAPEKDQDEKGAVRTDSPLIGSSGPPFGLAPPCRIFRDCTESNYCYKCDRRHALLFRGLLKSGIVENIEKNLQQQEYIEYVKQYIPDDSLRKRIEPKLKTTQDEENSRKRYYLEYDCPLLGYRELIFPIFFEQKVIAILWIGEIILEEKLGDIDKIRSSFFGKSDLTPTDKSKITKAHHKLLEKSVAVLHKKQYHELITKAFKGLQRLEDTLSGQMKQERERYVREKIDGQIRKFRIDFLSAKEYDLERLWDNLACRMENLIKDFTAIP